jgi:UDP:flavonoid glycosyltransferase YjiC (YdhE family)
MNVLLVPMGSAGDVFPYLGLGQALSERGHRVTVITSGYFKNRVSEAGLRFVELGTTEDYHAVQSNPKLWEARAGCELFARAIVPAIQPLYEIIRQHWVPGQTVIAAPPVAFGARVAQEKLGIPLVTVLLQPALLRSAYQSPKWPGVWLPDSVPSAFKRFLFRLADRFILDRLFAGETNALRRDLGLPPVERLCDRWWFSPQRVLGLFPVWFAPPQPDWPVQSRLTGFPLYDGRDVEAMSEEVVDFLEEGEAPIVFTAGTAMQYGQDFFAAAVAACRRLGRRGLLLTRFRAQVPRDLPRGIRQVDYVPFSQVLPRSAALVHHGGIGTVGQALAAGIPQVIVPRGFDQFDNAARLERLGVAATLEHRNCSPRVLADAIGHLLHSRDVATQCWALRRRVPNGSAVIAQTCAELERLVGHESGFLGRERALLEV